MKLIRFSGLVCLYIVVSACSNQTAQVNNAIYDMKTVQEYNKRVLTGNTVTDKQKKVVQNQVVDMPLNASDKQSKRIYRSTTIYPVIVPSINYGYYPSYRRVYY